MVKVTIIPSLLKEIQKKFKGEAHNVVDFLESLEESPKKGKELGCVLGVVIKELKYKSFRFYFITDGFKLRCADDEGLIDLLIRFIRMSDKNNQQETINEIKLILRKVGGEGFL